VFDFCGAWFALECVRQQGVALYLLLLHSKGLSEVLRPDAVMVVVGAACSHLDDAHSPITPIHVYLNGVRQ
jgi:hypothetical protein